jgi:AAA+ ATPase superfamily predicted ATPase
MTRPTITQVENAFQPAKEVDTAARFAGRREAVRDAYYGLIARGSHLAIVGNRGIGKTSLARQVLNLSRGDNDLVSKLNLPHDRKLEYLSIYFACGSTVSNTTDLLERLLTSATCLADWIYDIPKASKIVRGYKPKFGANIFGLEIGLEGEKKAETNLESAIGAHSIDTVFTNTVAAIIEEKLASDGILIVIDEFDQVGDPSGFASFLKSLSTNVPDVKFCIVGVAQDIQNLMREHQSSDRLFAGSIIALPSMSPSELTEIIRIAERSINGYITFSDGAVDRIVGLAQGHPYMVHLIGKYALRAAFHEDIRRIEAEAIDLTLKSIAERAADPVLEGRYKKAVASSEQRETVLKALADCQAADGEVWTTNAYRLALEQGVDNASQYVGQLVTDEYGCEVEKVRERYYRFHDSLFAAYVRARPRLVPRAE